jgi:GST-like protein
MYTLYGTKGSGSAAVEMALEMCGLPFRAVRASTWEPDSAQEELRKALSARQEAGAVLAGLLK